MKAYVFLFILLNLLFARNCLLLKFEKNDKKCNQCISTVLLYKYYNKLKCDDGQYCENIVRILKSDTTSLELKMPPCNICFRYSLCHYSECEVKNRIYSEEISESLRKSLPGNFHLIKDSNKKNDLNQLFSLFEIVKNKDLILLNDLKEMFFLLLDLNKNSKKKIINKELINKASKAFSTILLDFKTLEFQIRHEMLNLTGKYLEKNILYSSLTKPSKKLEKIKLYESFLRHLLKLEQKTSSIQDLYNLLNSLIKLQIK